MIYEKIKVDYFVTFSSTTFTTLTIDHHNFCRRPALCSSYQEEVFADTVATTLQRTFVHFQLLSSLDLLNMMICLLASAEHGYGNILLRDDVELG